MNKMKTLVAFATLMLCGGAWAVAPTPLVVWDNDFDVAEKSVDGTTFTLDLNNQAEKAADNTYIQMKSDATFGVLINVTGTAIVPATTPLSVLVRYENLTDTASYAIGYSTASANDKIGCGIGGSGSARLFNTAGGYYSTSTGTISTHSAGRFSFTYSSENSAMKVIHAENLAQNWNTHSRSDAFAKAAVDDAVNAISIGGRKAAATNSIAANGAMKNLKITGIAIFTESSFDPTEYMFPDEVKIYNAPSNLANLELTDAEYYVSIPPTATLPAGTKVSVKSLTLGSGSSNFTANVPKYLKIGDVLSLPVNGSSGTANTSHSYKFANECFKDMYVFEGKGLDLTVGERYVAVNYSDAGSTILQTTKWYSGTSATSVFFAEGQEKASTQEIAYRVISAPAGYKIVGNQVILDASQYSKWNNFNAIFTKISGAKFAYTGDNARMLDLTTGVESDVVMGTACAIPGHTSNATPWKTFTRANGNEYVAPGHVLRIAPGSTATAASDQADISAGIAQVMEVDFPSLSFGGLIIESGAPVFKITGSGDRQTFFGDQRTTGGVTAYFDIHENIVIARAHNANASSIKFFGDEVWTIDSEKKVTLNASETTEAKYPSLDAGSHANVKVVGGGQFVVPTLTATGTVTLDFSAQQLARETPVIDGMLVVDGSTTIALPEGMQGGDTFKIATTINGTPGTIKIGSTALPYNLNAQINEGAITLVKIVVAKIDDEEYYSLREALVAAEEGQTVKLLVVSTESVEIPANVTVTATPTAKITGAISGSGTYSIAKDEASQSSYGTDWFSAGQLANFTGTVLMTKGRFQLRTDEVAVVPSGVTLATSNQGKIYLASGKWNNKFVLAGNGWTGDRGLNMGPVALRVDSGSFGEDATIEVVVEGNVVPAIGVYNTSPTLCAISGTGGLRLRADSAQTITISGAKLNGLSGGINLVDSNVTLAIDVVDGETETVANNITGDGTVKKTGAGTLSMTKANQIAGTIPFVVAQGVVKNYGSVSGSGTSAFSDGAAMLTIQDGGAVDLNGAPLKRNVTIAGTGVNNSGVLYNSAVQQVDASRTAIKKLVLSDNATINVTRANTTQPYISWFGIARNDTYTLELGTHTLTKTGDGVFYLEGVTINGTGTIDVAQGQLYNMHDGVNAANATIVVEEGAKLNIHCDNQSHSRGTDTIKNVTFKAGSGLGADRANGYSTLKITGALTTEGDFTFGNTAASGAANLTLADGAVLNLGGKLTIASTYSKEGSVVINASSLLDGESPVELIAASGIAVTGYSLRDAAKWDLFVEDGVLKARIGGYPVGPRGDSPTIVLSDEVVSALVDTDDKTREEINTALTTPNANGISPIEAYVLGFEPNAAATAKIVLKGVQTNDDKKLRITLDGMPTPRVGLGMKVEYKVYVSTTPDGQAEEVSMGAATSVDIDLPEGDDKVKYIRIGAEITAGENQFTKMLANTPFADGLCSVDWKWSSTKGGQYRIPGIAMSKDGLVVTVYDCRYMANRDLGYPVAPGEMSGSKNRDGETVTIPATTYVPIDLAGNESTDRGVTWGAPKVVVDVDNCTNPETGVKNDKYSYLTSADRAGTRKEYDIGDPAIVYDPETDMFWCMAITGGGNSYIFSSDANRGSYNDVVLYKRSATPGSEWVEYVNPDGESGRSIKKLCLAEMVKAGETEASVVAGNSDINANSLKSILQGPGQGVVLRKACGSIPAGTIVYSMQYVGSVVKNFALYSTDHGETWKASKLVPDADTSEGCCAQLDDGSVIMMSRTNANSTGGVFYRSADLVNWTKVTAASEGMSAYGLPVSGVGTQGTVLRVGEKDGKSVYATAHVTAGAGWNTSTCRSDLKIMFGADNSIGHESELSYGIDWDTSKTIMVFEGPTEEKGYNSMVMLDDHTLGILYEANKHIYFERIDVSAYVD